MRIVKIRCFFENVDMLTNLYTSLGQRNWFREGDGELKTGEILANHVLKKTDNRLGIRLSMMREVFPHFSISGMQFPVYVEIVLPTCAGDDRGKLKVVSNKSEVDF